VAAENIATGLIGGRYELEALLGRGGVGQVWRARHVTLNSHVAIKFLHSASAQRETTRKRFLTEAQVTAQLKTRHAVQVFDYGFTDAGHPYLVMELLDGETVGHRLDRLKRLPPATAVLFLTQVSRELERAHALGIVHRDLKPDNLVIVADEEGREYIKVLDFGVAKLLGDLDTDTADDEDPTQLSQQDFATLTRTGAMLGTPYYMAPEQVRNSRDVDLRVDVWAFGVVAFECLTGKVPFDGKNLLQLFDRIRRGEHPPAVSLRPELPNAFDTWFEIACAVDREKRFPSARAAATTLALAVDPQASTTVDSAGGDLSQSGRTGGTDTPQSPREAGAGLLSRKSIGHQETRAGAPGANDFANAPTLLEDSAAPGALAGSVAARQPAGRRAWWLLAVPALVALTWIVMNRTSGSDRRETGATAATVLPPAPPPVTTPDPATMAAAVAAASPSVSPAASVPSDQASARAAIPPHAASAARSALVAAARPTTAPPAAPPASAPAPASPSVAPPAPPASPRPAASSPFELPPLGI
jgi:serine/threonine-protein kinase